MNEKSLFGSKPGHFAKILKSWSSGATFPSVYPYYGEIGLQDLPLKNTASLFPNSCNVSSVAVLFLIISATIRPRLQMSIALSYLGSIKIISGALYHLLETWGVSSLFLLLFKSFEFLRVSIIWSQFSEIPLIWSRSLETSVFYGRLLDKPKSQILTSQSSLVRRLAGFRSLCITLAEWRKLRAHNKL